ncbi:MAG: tetratricopeptide repeat protein [Lutibacter sp.]|nr:tetratricopeptide repeat protein [Lutibacter sp.]MDP3945520.1 tetratricopeptide repeat protein [Lutibacter sp.]
MKFNYFLIFLAFLFGCTNNSNNPELIKKATGRYLYNSDEVVKVYFEENEMYLAWRGANKIKPLKVDDATFFVKEMNEKIQFLTNPENKISYMVLVPKEENKPIEYNFRKLKDDEIVPSEYLENKEFDKALEGYLAIKKKDSLDSSIDEKYLNSLGYKALKEKNFEMSKAIFKINAALYPNSSNVYDSLGEAYLKSGDTLKAIEYYQKSLTLDSGNFRAKQQLKKLEKKT